MKNIYLMTLLSVLLFSCSSDDSSPSIENMTQLPTIESVSTTTATAGDVITITGKNFDSNTTYVVKFNEVEGTVTEVTPTFLKAQVPENATSGDITLTSNGETIVVGSIQITPPTPTTASRLFGYIANDKIVELNIETGEEINTLITIGQDYFSDVTFSKSTNEIIGHLPSQTNMNDEIFYKINVATGEATQKEYSGYERLIATNTGKLYGYVAYDKIVELNIQTGEEISTLATIGPDYFKDIVYSESTNEIIGQISVFDDMSNAYMFTYYRINADTGEITTKAYTGYESLIITDSGKLYGYVAYDKIVELDIETGEELSTLATIGQDYFSDVVYSENTNEIIGQVSTFDGNSNSYTYYRINATTGEITTKAYAGYEHLIIKND
ncbi:IPT/TIG domain-containing protein [Aquimarina mytili]|uniref:IPT/TIG domain-containing protein n=1 Tax=Aquimarina mytili TaxID=874423 RepID=A0A936ZS12_9FLAO|nr:IPT/TIG domain-containing protein [Aquimarina mytili]MBL0684569.1 IPT/TIG domain-containing protein [Aquimarina mytili]